MIGIFDSGVGGLSVLLETRKLKPNAKVIYFSDSANFPYGEKTQEELVLIASKATQTLKSLGADTIVVACNSATVSTINFLRHKYPEINFIGVEPAIRLAVTATNHGKIGLLATKKTVNTHESDFLAAGKKIYKHYDEKIIDMIENSYSEINSADIHKAINPLISQGVDTIVLGCTHFYFLKDQFRHEFPNVTFIEPADIIAQRVIEVAGEIELGNTEFLVSGDETKFANFIDNIVGYKHAKIRKI